MKLKQLLHSKWECQLSKKAAYRMGKKSFPAERGLGYIKKALNTKGIKQLKWDIELRIKFSKEKTQMARKHLKCVYHP